MGCLGFGNGQGLVDCGLHQSCFNLRVNVADDAGKYFRLHLGSAGTEGAADNSYVSDVDILKVYFGFGAGEGGYHNPARAVGEVMNTLAHNLAAEAVYGDVNAVTLIKLLFKHLGDILLGGYNHSICP